jgi:hypothetical protein
MSPRHAHGASRATTHGGDKLIRQHGVKVANSGDGHVEATYGYLDSFTTKIHPMILPPKKGGDLGLTHDNTSSKTGS